MKFKVNPNLKPWFPRVKIDQLEQGIYLKQESLENGVADRLCEFAHQLMAGKCLKKGITGYTLPASKLGDSYMYRVGIKYENTLLGFLFISPFDKYASSLPFLKIVTFYAEIFMLETLDDDWWAYQEYLNKLITPKVAKGILATRFSRIDFAFDQEDINTEDYLWFGKGLRSHFTYEASPPTYYLGGVNSAARYCIYDKHAQLLAKNSPIKIEHDSLMRVELRLGKGKAIPNGQIVNLEGTKNRWKVIHPVSVADLPKVFPTLSDPEVIQSVKRIGLQAYLDGMSSYKKNKYRKALLALPQPKWWDPDEIWERCLSQTWYANRLHTYAYED